MSEAVDEDEETFVDRIAALLLVVARAERALSACVHALRASPLDFPITDPFVAIINAARATCSTVLESDGWKELNAAIAERLSVEAKAIHAMPGFVAAVPAFQPVEVA